MSSHNRVILVGNLGGAPEVKRGQNQRGDWALMNLSVATTETWGKGQDRKQHTDWHRVVVKSDRVITFLERYAKKGAKVLVEGKLRTRQFEDQEGNKRTIVEVEVGFYDGEVRLIGSRSSEESDDIPFPDADVPGEEEARW